MIKTLRVNAALVSAMAVLVAGGLGMAGYTLASTNSDLTLAISNGTFGVDIVNVDDSSYSTVEAPTVALSGINFSWTAQNTTGTLGSATEAIYVSDQNAALDGWNITMAPSQVTTTWSDGGSNTFDFNDSSAGKLTVDASGGTLAKGRCSLCDTDNVSKGSETTYNHGITDSVTLASATDASDALGDWKLTEVSLTQLVPAQTPIASYTINMILTATAL